MNHPAGVDRKKYSLITSVRKRSGDIVDFDKEKIKTAVKKSFEDVKQDCSEDLTNEILEKIIEEMQYSFHHRSIPAIEEIQDLVERVLMNIGEHKVAKNYILYREEKKKAREFREELLDGQATGLKLKPEQARVIGSRYLTVDKEGKTVETPEDMFMRVAKALAEVEFDYLKTQEQVDHFTDEFYEIMSTFKFLPAGRTLRNAGGPTKLVNNCIVLHFKDDLRDIFETLTEAAVLQQAGSGLGFAFHLLRPAGIPTVRTRGSSSGPVSFLQIYDKAFGIIKQQGRHGANMAVMKIDHPDILEFINCKRREGDIANFNISIGITDKFMRAVESESEKPWMCEWKGEKMKPRRIFRDSVGRITKMEEVTMTAKEIFDEILDAAWENGEPGVVFLDAVNRTNPLPKLGDLEACNPCGEQFLHDGDVCNLGSLNLEKFVTEDGKVDWKDMERVVRLATRLLDNVIDKTDHPSNRVNTMFRSNRRIGLGVMGFGNALYKLRISYSSEEGRKMAEKMMKFVTNISHDESGVIAGEKGVFPNYDLSIWKEKGIKMRNVATTTVAPTGSISMAAHTSSGIEPNFAIAYKKVVQSGVYNYFNEVLKEALQKEGVTDEKTLSSIVERGSVQHVKELSDEFRSAFVTSMEISAEDHIKMQAAFQKNVDNAISKTINFDNSASRKDIATGYMMGWKANLKGLTVYRDGSREVQVLELNNREKKKKKTEKKEEINKTLFSADMQRSLTESSEEDCPDCNNKMQQIEGCATCMNCGFSYCEK